MVKISMLYVIHLKIIYSVNEQVEISPINISRESKVFLHLVYVAVFEKKLIFAANLKTH